MIKSSSSFVGYQGFNENSMEFGNLFAPVPGGRPQRHSDGQGQPGPVRQLQVQRYFLFGP